LSENSRASSSEGMSAYAIMSQVFSPPVPKNSTPSIENLVGFEVKTMF